MIIMEDEVSSSSSSNSSVNSVNSDSSTDSSSQLNNLIKSSAGSPSSSSSSTEYKICLRTRRARTRACVTPPPPPPQVGGDKGLKSPPTTPHKIQSLDEKSLRLDENFISISPSTTIKNDHITASNHTKPLNSTHQNKTVKYVDGENGNKEKPSDELNPARRRLKLTDYFVQRRSNRKTQEAIKTEKNELLVKAIIDGKQDGLMAKRFSGKGRGVVATKPFLRHEFVVEYAGELLIAAEARAREAKYAKDSGAGCYMYYFQYNNQQYCVDATKESDRFGRLINHSRNGNLVTKVVEVKGTPRLILIAKRDVEVGEELCYDYGDRSREALRHHPWLAY